MTKAFVITIMDNERSVQVADRCIASGKKFGLTIDKWAATTPKDDPQAEMFRLNLPYRNFSEVYSRQDRAAAAFLSHHSLWKLALESKEDIIIFEHDAVLVAPIPNVSGYQGCVSFGAPSYGRFETPRYLGLNELTSKKYFPGAHAYQISWQAAEVVMKKAKIEACPTDLFFHKDRFRFLQEYYPFPVVAKDSFTTIQSKRGCLAKHEYDETLYDII